MSEQEIMDNPIMVMRDITSRVYFFVPPFLRDEEDEEEILIMNYL